MRLFKDHIAKWLLCAILIAWFVHAAFPICYRLSALHIRQEQRNIIAEEGTEHLSHFLLSYNVFVKTYDRYDKELRLDGRLYDVASYTVTGDLVSVTALCDERETELQGRYLSGIEKEQDAKKALSWWWPLAYATSALSLVLPKHIISPKSFLFFIHDLILSGYLKNEPRPPEC